MALKLSIVELSPEQERQVENAFKDVVLRDEAVWYPEFDAPAALRSAVARVRWGSDNRFRLRVYGEFAQWLRPQVGFAELGRLEPAVKRDAEGAFLASSLKPHLVTELDVVRDALAVFSVAYGRAPSPHDARIAMEQARRWTL